MSAPIPSREIYESGSGGWADGRLGQAYDLIDAVMQDQHREHVSRMMLRVLLGSVEAADIEIGHPA